MKWVIRAPDHLGDGVMALPAIHSLAAAFSSNIPILGPAWCQQLYPAHPCFPPSHRPDADGVILFKPSFGAAWRFRHYAQRIGLQGNFRDFLLTQAVAPTNGHRKDDYLAIIQTIAPPTITMPIYTPPNGHTNLKPNDYLLIVGTASPKTVRWRHFRKLASLLPKEQVVVAGGPGDEEAVASIGQGYRQLETTLSIAEFAYVTQQAHTVIGLDSGLSHLAAASRAALNKGRTFIIYGSTSPHQTGPLQTVPVHHTRPDCWPCYGKRCPIKSPCLDTPATHLLEVLS